MKMKITTVALFLSVFTSAFSQTIKYCGNTEIHNQLVKDHPELLIEQEKLEQFTQEFIQNQSTQKTTSSTPYIIPIVFHIVHNYGAENISDAQIYDAVKVINRDYRKLNTDTNLIISQFKSIAADCNIEFRLAQIDPNGNCTNGIDRIASSLTHNADDNSKLNPWPRNKYLNVWVVASIGSGAAGYAYFPGFMPSSSVDGIMILNSYVGSIGTASPNTSRALTHEIGHFLNLQHVWGNTNQPGVSCGDDGVTDTPVTKGWNYCPTTTVAKSCNASIVENYQNYMEYSYCDMMFTAKQAVRMQAALNSPTSQRSSLWQSSNLTATGVSLPANLCKAEFTANKTVICETGTVIYKDASWNGTATSWAWSFPGGSPSSSTASSDTVTYPTAGVYDVTLKVGNGSTSPSTTKTGFITVYSNIATQNLPFVEGFETGAIPNSKWSVNNIDNKYGWQVTSSAKYSGSSCIWLNNFPNDTAQVDEFIGPTIDLTTMVTPKLFYRVAYAQYDVSNNDILRVMVSTNCGATWSTRQTRSGKSNPSLKSVPPQTNAFTPTSASQWRLDSVSLSPYVSSTNVRIKFQFQNALGNNIYIDDINIKGNGFTGINDPVTENIVFSIYPNPVQENATISFNLIDKGKVTLQLFDILGKEVINLVNGQQLNANDYKYSFNTTGMISGIYFVKLMVDDKLFVQKVIVQ